MIDGKFIFLTRLHLVGDSTSSKSFMRYQHQINESVIAVKALLRYLPKR